MSKDTGGPATDRELLELAAKAAGVDELQFSSDMECPYNPLPENGNIYWNPLRCDGDALRLATKLDMSVEISEYEGSTYAYAGKVPRVYACENWRGDKPSATRRAITRAAAELGKAKP